MDDKKPESGSIDERESENRQSQTSSPSTMEGGALISDVKVNGEGNKLIAQDNRNRIDHNIVGEDITQYKDCTIKQYYEKKSAKERSGKLDEDVSFKIDKYRCPSEELVKISQTFVEPPSFKQLKDQIKNKLIILSGDEGSGKLTAALYLGSTLIDESKVDSLFIFSDALKVAPSVFLKKLPPKSFVVIENAFDDNNSLGKRLFGKGDTGWITPIKNTLRESYIIAVSKAKSLYFSTATRQDLIAKGILIENFQRPEPRQILERHMLYTLSKEQKGKVHELLKEGQLQTLVTSLVTPQKIVKFVEYSLSRIDVTANSSDLWQYFEKQISDLLNINSEVKRYFEELSDEGRTLAITLSLFHEISEPELWYVHGILNPKKIIVPAEKDEHEKDKSKAKPISPFATPKFKLLEEIRANVISTKIESDAGESVISQVEFDDDRYPSEILSYIKSNYPEYLENLIPTLIRLIRGSLGIWRQHIARALGRIARINWPVVSDLAEECANDDIESIRAVAGHIFETAIDDKMLSNSVGNLLLGWSSCKINEKNWKLLWTATSAYKQIGQFNIQFALSGLKRIISRLDVEVPELPTLIVFNSASYALKVLAIKGQLNSIIETLNEWIANSEEEKNDSIKITVAFIWFQIAATFASSANENKSPNEILILASQSEEAFIALSKLTTSIFVILHAIKIDGKPMSNLIFGMAEDWIDSSDETYTQIAVEIVRRVRFTLKQSHKKYYDYFTAYLRKIWLAKRQKEKIKSAAKIILNS